MEITCNINRMYIKHHTHCSVDNESSVPNTQWNPTCARTMGHDYPITRPSPGDNPSIYPSFRDLPHTGVKTPTRRQNSHKP